MHVSRRVHTRHAVSRSYYSGSVEGLVYKDEYKCSYFDYEHLFRSCYNIDLAKCLHCILMVSGNARRIHLSTRLTNLYANLGNPALSKEIFDWIPNKDVYTWNSMISIYVRSGRSRDALRSFYQLVQTSDVRPDFYTFPSVLKACDNLTDGEKMHCWVFKLGLIWDVYVAASLIHMYSRFKCTDLALHLFGEMTFRDMGAWNAMISGLCQYGNASDALDFFTEMRLLGVEMDAVTVAAVLPACAQAKDKSLGMTIHVYAVKHGLEDELFVGNALIDMYSKFGKLEDARRIFCHMMVRDIVSWNSIIATYEQNGDAENALEYFNKMQLSGVQPDNLTIVSLASAVAQSKNCENSKLVHGFALRKNLMLDYVVVANAVMDMYAKLGVVDSARIIFWQIPEKDVISWNTLITGYSQNGLASEAIELYNEMAEFKEILPNQGTWVSILPAYSHVGSLRQGMKVHGQVIKNSFYLDVYVSTCLIDMYGKCGRLEDALALFYQGQRNNAVLWNAIISCHGLHGHGDMVMKLFNEMRNEGVKPDHITFVSLLSSCSHSGMVDVGKWCFSLMQVEYRIKPTLKHYGCMVDLFGRAGLFDDAYDFIQKMPVKPDASIWGALLGACRIHGNFDLGSLASQKLFEVDPNNVGYYILMSNIYANVGKWEGVKNVRSLARGKGLVKTPGWSSIELNNMIDVFYTATESHPQLDEIYKELGLLLPKMKALGYVPDFSFVLQDVEDDEKEHILTSHSERLAIAFGILNTPPKSPICVFKNLRVCGDCHNATKYISIITERDITVRDSNRFHHFKNGVCSCGDYW
ncbi:hypothetical protein QQ045_032820 [Rhodiola kirilowii]